MDSYYRKSYWRKSFIIICHNTLLYLLRKLSKENILGCHFLFLVVAIITAKTVKTKEIISSGEVLLLALFDPRKSFVGKITRSVNKSIQEILSDVKKKVCRCSDKKYLSILIVKISWCDEKICSREKFVNEKY